MIENAKKVIYYSAIYLLVFLTSLMTTTGATLILGGVISHLQMILSIIISLIVLYFFDKKKDFSLKIISIIITFFIVFITSFVESKYYDLSWDSNAYHKDAIGMLKNGWNPIYEDYISFYKRLGNRDMNYVGDEIQDMHGVWQTYYAKGVWLVNANFYYWTNNIEASKVFNVLIAFICFVFSFNFLYKVTKKNLLSVFMAIIFSISPIVIVQLFDNYIDGALYNTLLCIVIEYILFIKSEDKKHLLTLFCLIIICTNIKFTGFAYAGIYCFGLYILQFWNNRKKAKKMITPTIVFAISVLVAILITGFQPYVTNFVDKGHPFYPLFGKDKIDIMTHNQPYYYNDIGTIKRFGLSMFSETRNLYQRQTIKPTVKIPFTVSAEELNYLSKNDLRMGGFGVYYSGIFLISLIVILYGLIDYYKHDFEKFKLLSVLVSISIILIFGLSESWWARYTPFVYFLTLIALVILVQKINKKNYLYNNIFIIFMILIFVNLSFYLNNNIINNFKESREMRRVINKYKRTHETLHLVCHNDFIGIFYTFDDNKIKYDLKKNPNKKLYKMARSFRYWED